MDQLRHTHAREIETLKQEMDDKAFENEQEVS
jgi:hypothetical protein